MSNTYLLTWNPSRWDFEGGYKTFLQSVKNSENPIIEWRAANSSIRKGDILYVMRLGEEPRGIILKGIAMGSVHPSKHYDQERADKGEVVNRVTVRFVSGGDYSKGEYVDWSDLKVRFPNQNWTPQASGVRIRDEYCNDLDELWDQINRTDLRRSDIKHDLVVIKIGQTYKKGMTPRELYEFTRGFWKNRIEYVEPAKYALSVVDGKVIEVYKIFKWVHASQADNMLRTYNPETHAKKIVFNGEVAPDDIRNYYLGRNVKPLFEWGNAHAVTFFSADENNENANDINTPMRPKSRNRKVDGSYQFICGRCTATFNQASRCPECGQLVKE